MQTRGSEGDGTPEDAVMASQAAMMVLQAGVRVTLASLSATRKWGRSLSSWSSERGASTPLSSRGSSRAWMAARSWGTAALIPCNQHCCVTGPHWISLVAQLPDSGFAGFDLATEEMVGESKHNGKTDMWEDCRCLLCFVMLATQLTQFAIAKQTC